MNGGRNITGPPAPPILGVGQGPGNASPKYTATTATGLSATDPGQFVFAGTRGGSPSGSPSHPGRGSPSASATSPNSRAADPFNAQFTFAAAQAGLPPHQSGVVTGAPLVESIPPHSALPQSRPQQQAMQQQEYLHPSGYTPHLSAGSNKRRRADTAIESGGQSHDPDSDYEHLAGQSSGSMEGYSGYEQYGDAYEYEGQYHDGNVYEGGSSYPQQMGQPGLMPAMMAGMTGLPVQGVPGNQMGQPAQEQKQKP